MLSKFFTFSLIAFIALLFTTMSYGQVVIFVDNFDSYTAGMQLVVQNPIDWETYSGGSGTGEDPYVSDLYAFGGTNSVVIVPNNDLVKPLGDLTSGKYSIAFMVYIPTGKNGIFSTLSDFITGSVWESAMGVVFDPGGSGRLNAGGFGAAIFTYAYDTWQSVKVIVDLDNDIGEFWFEGVMIHTWQWTLGAMGTGSALQLAASEFWVHSPGNHEMYFDNYVFTDLLAPFFDDFESYTVGGQLACQNPTDWTTWNLIPCDPSEDPVVSDLYAFSGLNSVAIGQTNTLVKLYGDLTSGKYSTSFKIYVPTGKHGVFSTMSGFTGGAYEWGASVEFNTGGSGQIHAGGFGAETFTYSHDTWQSFELIVDLDNDIGEFWFEGVMVHTWQWTLGSMGTGGALQLAAGEFWALSVPGEMYIDDFGYDSVITSVENEGDVKVPSLFSLEQNFPNPFNPLTKIKYQIPELSFIILKIYDVLGNEIITIVNEEKPAGTYTVDFNATNLPSGIYFYQLQTPNFTQTKKMILLR